MQNKPLKKVLTIVGSTASGKTTLAIEIAKRINGEIISLDSRQVFKGMAIGTAQPTKKQMDTVKHHLIGCLEPAEFISLNGFAITNSLKKNLILKKDELKNQNHFFQKFYKYDYNVGDKKRIIKINNNISYIPVICYEIIFYWKLVDNINLNSDLIINITNDIWFGKYLGPYQHFYHSKLRAAEIGKPLIRVSNNGISAIFNENGNN